MILAMVEYILKSLHPRIYVNIYNKGKDGGKKRHFHIISGQWFRSYHEIAARNHVFHDDIKSRTDMGDAREIRMLIDSKN